MLSAPANILSTIFHPIFFPVYGLLFINWADVYKLAGLDETNKVKFFSIIILNTIIFPVITVVIMKRLGFVKNVFLRGREERIIPFITGGLFYFWTFMVVRSLSISTFITEIFLGASLVVFACFFLTLFFKISIHCAAAGGFMAIALFMTFSAPHNLEIPLMIIIILAGMIGSARWYLKEHVPFEIFSGYAVGFLSQLIAFKLI